MKIPSGLRRAAVSLLLATSCMPALARRAAGQGVSLVPIGDLVYRDVDRLVQLGLLDSVIVGQRPYTRQEFGRIVRIARERLDRGGVPSQVSYEDDAMARAGNLVLARLEQRFGDAADQRLGQYPMLSLLDGAALIFTSTNADRRGFPEPQSVTVDATIDPLAEPRLAQPALHGNVTDLELSQRIAPASWLEFYGRERIEYRVPLDTTAGRMRGELLTASMRAGYRNVVFVAGREPLGWAQAEGDGLFFASDAPAIDQLSVRGASPFTMSGFLRRLGPTQATLTLADLGPSSVRSGSKLLAYKVSVQPAQGVELGGTFMNHFGGAGGRGASLGNRLIDFLPFIDIFRRHNYVDTTRTFDVDSDKLLGVDGRVGIAPLAGMTIAGEMLIDDFDIHALRRMLTGYGSQTVRLIFPVVGTPDVSVQVGAKHMGTITYTHSSLTSGIATRGRLLGDELGPDAKEFSANVRWWPVPSLSLSLEGHEQWYSNAVYQLRYTDAEQVATSYTKVSSAPDERRHLLIGNFVARPDADLSFTIRAGAQVADNYAFGGQRRTDYVAGVALRLRQ